MNFIGDLDLLLEQEKKEVKKRFGDNSINKNFGLDRYLEVSYGDKKYNFLIRKNEKTRFHINMNNVRVYLSDFDILELLIDNFPNHGNEIINEIINFLNSKVKDPTIGEMYGIKIFDESSKLAKEYYITGMKLNDDDVCLTNKFDLQDLSLNYLKVLINLILAKDILSKELGDQKTPDYLKRTTYKYLIILKLVILEDKKIIQTLQQKELYTVNAGELEWKSILNSRKTEAKKFFNNVEGIELMNIL
ncbi:MAG: hypothetical protein D8H99_25825 [Streptococcus sp.]|nr:MAG: hypothetical protein D8H99_25825 [Streptococcus sp.]